MCLRVSYKKKNMKKIFFCFLKVTEVRSRIRIRINKSDVWMPIRIRTKMSRIPNTGYLTWVLIFRAAYVGSYLPYIGTATILYMVGIYVDNHFQDFLTA